MSYCSNCGTELPAGSKFCDECGTATSQATTGSVSASASETREFATPLQHSGAAGVSGDSGPPNRTPLIVAAIVIITIGFLGWWSIGRGDSKTQLATSSGTTTLESVSVPLPATIEPASTAPQPTVATTLAAVATPAPTIAIVPATTSAATTTVAPATTPPPTTAPLTTVPPPTTLPGPVVPALTQSCRNDFEGYALLYPEGWYTEDGGLTDLTCSLFDPNPFVVDIDSEFPVVVASVFVAYADINTIRAESLDPFFAGATYGPVDIVVAGYPAMVTELVHTGEGYLAAGTLTAEFWIDVGGARTLILSTTGPAPDYHTNQLILDAIARSLVMD